LWMVVRKMIEIAIELKSQAEIPSPW